jgi:hypothetical protein
LNKVKGSVIDGKPGYHFHFHLALNYSERKPNERLKAARTLARKRVGG